METVILVRLWAELEQIYMKLQQTAWLRHMESFQKDIFLSLFLFAE